ncbi:TonB-dependent receptor domain-containing protein [Pontibacter locisalis]|uniref:TonB-dependent receptor domain-containing protein n=1 Tax=Pontibacter locisalis TaxID=1719035 RepID=A0ABW5IP36_9BACT
MKNFLFSTLLMLLCAAGLHAQVTTSSITGSVKDSKGEALIGATVRATHQPSGTTYGGTTNAEGRFNISNARIGGPYQIEVSYLGYTNKTYNGVNLNLGQPYILNAVLSESGTELKEVVVSADRTSVFNSSKTGAATNISSRQLETLPTISRSIQDFTRTTPQANGNSFGGRDARFNSIQVDGANLNNNFGLSSSPMPGGGAQPISLDAYDEISVNIAPYDVRQSGFTGAGINAVTKSGTNTFKGTAYTFFRDQSFIGTKVGDNDISANIQDSKSQTYGFSLGGPILKNKLFFFVNGEIEKESRPGIAFSPTGGSGLGTVSTTPVADLQAVSNYLKNAFGYETGGFDNFPNFANDNRKFLAKLDWNISDIHKLTVKYTDFQNTNDQIVNATSIPNGGGFSVTGRSGTLSRLPYSRFSNNAMGFANSKYIFKDIVKTGTAELNSNFGGKMSNQLLATASKIQTTRDYPGGIFPTIDIFDGKGNNYIHAGMDPFTYNNDVINDVYSITNNFSYYAGKHTITAGLNYEYQRVANMFMAASNSYYAFNSLDDFLNNRAPAYYAYTYSLVPGQDAVYSAELKVGQLGLYLQDEIQVKTGLTVTAGLRADKAIYHEQPIENPAVTEMQFFDEKGNLTNYTTGSWAKSKVLLSPRVGFRWDVMNDASLVLRGGTGLFTGKFPFVWLTNMPTNSGMYQFGSGVTKAADLDKIRFNPNPDAHAAMFPRTAGTSVPPNLVFMNEDFQFPQVFRSNLAADKDLGSGFTLTLEGMFTKEINGIKMRNANLYESNGTFTEGGNTRERYLDRNNDKKLNNDDRRLNSAINSAIVLENTNKGYSTALTAQLSKSFANGFYGSVAYNYTLAKGITANPGSQAGSVWSQNPNIGTANGEELGFQSFATPHRVVANLSYRKEYLNHFASTISIFYEGANQSNYSFIINGDLNGDGNSSSDLMYIPADRSEMNFADYVVKNKAGEVQYSFTAAEQEEAFEQFINNSPYLSKNRGQYAERSGALLPWYNRMDMRFLQDFFIVTGKKDTKHTLQFSADVLNLPNMINKNWGIEKRFVTANPLKFEKFDSENKPVYTFQNQNGELVTEPFEDVITTSSTWRLQLGLRYSF